MFHKNLHTFILIFGGFYMKTKEADAKYMFDFIKNICDKHGPRPSASEAELNATEDIEKQLQDLGCDEVFTDDFYLHPGAYPQGFVKIPFVLILTSYLLYLFIPIIVLFLVTFALIVFIVEFPLMKEFIDPLFKKKLSRNVFGKIKPKKETRKIVIIGGHTDSANVFPLFQKTRRGILKYVFGMIGIVAIFMVYAVITFIIQVMAFSLSNTFLLGLISLPSMFGFPFPIFFNIGYVVFLCALPFILYVLLNTQFFTKPVMGANDNLSGVAIAMGIANYVQQHDRYEHVELWCGSFGSEESGQRGSKAFVKKYGDELGILNNAYTLIPESVGVADIVGFISAEEMHFVKHSDFLLQEFQKAYEACLAMVALSGTKFCKMGISPQDFAGTDAMRFSEKGYEAIAFIGADKDDQWPLCYHSFDDVPENIRPEPMRYLLEVILTFLEKLDKDLAAKE